MKTIKIFLASSEELDSDRMVFGNLVRRLDDMYEKRGIRIKLFEWEDYDAAYNDRRKQDEYNDYVKQSDIFLALFHKKAGMFTIEEFNIATEEFKQHASPKVYTYCKDLQPGEEESPELATFKKQLFDEMGHYWCRYDNRDTLQLQFVMQLQLVESSQMDGLKVEDGTVTVNGLPVAKMDKLRFAAANEDYIRMQTDLHDLHEEIIEMQLKLEKKQQKLEKKKAKWEEDPDDEDNKEEYEEVKEEVDELVDKLQPKLNKYNKLKEDFAQHQKLLFNSAMRVAQLQGERITERMRRAMDALNEGKVHEANIILDEAEADARRNLEDYKQSKEITEQKRQNVISSIEELLLKTSSGMADGSIAIEERISQVECIYQQAYDMAQEVDYEETKYADLISKYAQFLRDYAKYDKALTFEEELLGIRKKMFGEQHPDTAKSFNNIGELYHYKADYARALEYYQKALEILKLIFCEQYPNSDTATCYNNIGLLYQNLGDNKHALEYCLMALKIFEGILPKETPLSYISVGMIYSVMGNNGQAYEYYMKAKEVCEKVLGEKHVYTATTYNHISNFYLKNKDYQKALEYSLKSLKSYELIFGRQHMFTAIAYQTIGVCYRFLKEYDNSLSYCLKALPIFSQVHGEQHVQVAACCNSVANALKPLGRYEEALDYYKKALDIRQAILPLDHPDIKKSMENIQEVENLMKQ